MDFRSTLLEAIEAASEVRFEPDEHRYFIPELKKERELPSVTKVLEQAGFSDWLRMIDAGVLEYARLRGEYVHAATELLDKDDLDWDYLDEEIKPYVEAYAEWKQQSSFEVLAIEKPMANHRLGYAGKPDRMGLLEDFPAVLDIKAGAEDDAHSLQTAGYTMLVDPFPMRRVVLYLKDKGTFRAHEFPLNELGDDCRVFRAALEVTRWKRSR